MGIRTCWYGIHRGKSAGRKRHAESDTWCSGLFVFLEHSRTVSSEKTGRKGLVSDEPQTPKRLQNSQRIGIIATPRVGNIRLTPPCLARCCHSYYCNINPTSQSQPNSMVAHRFFAVRYGLGRKRLFWSCPTTKRCRICTSSPVLHCPKRSTTT